MAENTTSRPVSWYRSPLSPEDFKELHKRSDFRGWVQTLGYVGVLFLTGASVLFASSHHAPWPLVVALIFLNGMAYSFLPNGMHELGHGTVFKTKFWNGFFERILAFLGWMNFGMFTESHSRHHRYTLHPPDDQEVVFPSHVIFRQCVTNGIINPRRAWWTIKYTIRIARGKFEGDWELTCYPPSDLPKRRLPVWWARFILLGHGLIIAASIYFKLWLLPVVVTLAPFYGEWLFFLCNNAQHTGLQDKVADFRLCCRTITLNPAVEFMYWHMNFHTEHHMYAAVPCYNLNRLHQLIKHDLPPCPHGVVETWKEIIAILEKQKTDPNYQHAAPLPSRA